jgi:AraC family transcriptional regulator, regulatory protein of adaptative response / methylated-DNA-[protein]-cysteine methyltransferase
MYPATRDYSQLSTDYARIEQALLYLERNFRRQPALKDVAESIGLSEYHFQRLFTRWVGISPKRFLQYLTKEYALRLLEQSADVLETAYQSGLSGPGRLHDLLVTCEAVTPGEYKLQGAGLAIRYGFHPSPFGECLLAATGRGVCALAFVDAADRARPLQALEKQWAKANLVEDPAATRPLVERIFAPQSGQELPPLSLYLKGTNFQIKVWEALLRIPPGSVVSYENVAVAIGMPSAARAVSNAVAHNPIPVIIPCHRVIRKMGAIGGYRYGVARKKAMLGWEMARAEGLVE